MKGQSISHYSVLDELGEGGGAVVYRAEDVALRREVALKFLPAQLTDYAGIARFQHEARTASSLNHPNICTIYEIGEHEGRHFLAMELLTGEVLSRLIAGRPLDTYRIVELGAQVADALEAAHAAGIVHRDVKPANLFVTARDQIKLLDFGLAVLTPQGATLGSATPQALSASTCGTIPYMSPEQVRGEEVDSRTDLFSLGVVLYEMATGARPFGGANAAEVMDAIVNAPHLPIRELNPSLPAELERIVDKALEKNRKLRFQTASDLHSDLRRLKRDLDSVTSVNARALQATSAKPPARRRPGRQRTALVGGLVIAGGAILAAVAVAKVGQRKNVGPPTAAQTTTGADIALPPPAPREESPSPVAAATPVRSTARPNANAPWLAALPVNRAAVPGANAENPASAAGASDRSADASRAAAVEELRIARQKIELKLYDQALDTLRRVVSQHPGAEAVEASFLIASIHDARGATDDAMSAYLEIASRHADDPRAPEALVRMAQATLKSKRRDKETEAIRTLNQAVEKYRTSSWAPRALLVRGEIEERLNTYQRDELLATSSPTAVVTYRDLAQRYPTSSAAATALYRLARLYMDGKRFTLAAETFERLAAREDGNAVDDAWFAAGDVYDKRLKDPARAKWFYQRVPTTSPRYQEAQKRLRK